MYDRQVHPDQTKTVKGQNSKILVTAGTIKRPLPCPVQRIEKQGSFHNVKEKQSKRKKKRLERKQREKERKLRKKGES